MSDPLSVAAGVIGIVTVAVQVSKALIDFTNGTKDAPRQATVVLEKVNSIHVIMSQLQPFLLGLQTPDQSRSCLIHVDAVRAILTGCVATLSELQQVLDGLRAEGLGFLDKIKWAKKESVIGSLITRLETHESSLSLLLSILNGYVRRFPLRSKHVLNDWKEYYARGQGFRQSSQYNHAREVSRDPR